MATLTITTGGTYTGTYQSTDVGTPAVTISTTQPVTLSYMHIIHKGVGVWAYDTKGTNLTIRDCTFDQTDPGSAVRHRAVETDQPASFVFEYNRLNNADGVLVHGLDTALDIHPLTIRYNECFNVGYYPHPADTGNLVQFFQLDNGVSSNGVVQWNHVQNTAGQSDMEDAINFYIAGGTDSSHDIDIGWNLIDGAYSRNLTVTDFTGGGINLGDGGQGSGFGGAGNNYAHDNVVVSTTNYGISVNGPDNYADNNLLVNDGVEQTNDFGQAIVAFPEVTPPGLHATNTRYNWHRYSGSGQYSAYQSQYASGTQVSTTEQQARDEWEAARIAAGVTVGPRSIAPTGTIAAALRKATASLSGRMQPKGTVAVSLKRGGVAGVGVVTFTGGGASSGVAVAALKRASFSATGREHPRGAISASPKRVKFSGTGKGGPVGSVAVALRRANAALSGREHPKGTVSAALKRAKYSALAGFAGAAAITLKRSAITVTGYERPKGVIASRQTRLYTAFIGLSLAQQSNAIWDATRRARRAEDLVRRQEPFVRIWDAEWTLQHLCSVEYKAQVSWISNDSGPGRIEIPADKPVAEWIQDQEGRIDRGEGRNVHVTVDYCGARWGGRLDKYAVEQREDGDIVLVCDFLHDYENMKWYSVWSNPFLPAAFQWPRAFLLAGPVTWILKLALFLQIFREHNPLITWPDDPLDLSSWFTSLDMSTWNVVVAPNSFLNEMASGVVWGVISSRWANWHDMAHTMLEDAELSVTCRRYLPGDPQPWQNANLRYGTLIVDIVDKSGVNIGTSHGGTIFDGLVRTVAEFADDFIDSTLDVIADADTPQNYFTLGHRYTDKTKPYVVFQEGDNSPIQTSAFIVSPAKGVQVNVGGHSMPGVNEAISATIQAGFDVLGGLAQIGSLGGTVDTLLRPLYEDTILAWWSVKSPLRAQHSGWSRYFEYFQDVGSQGMKAYTIASLMVLRAGFWATKTVTTWKVEVVDGLPFMVGDNGIGHFFLDDRVGLVLAGDHTGTIQMDRCRKLDLAWDEKTPPEWAIEVGDPRILQDPAQRAWGKLESLVAGLRDLGVY